MSENLHNLKIHKLSQERYNSELENSAIDSTAVYLTPESYNAKATGEYAHAEGYNTLASGNHSHAEGAGGTTASGTQSHAEGYHCAATGDTAHAEGLNTCASGDAAHAEGSSSNASGFSSHAEGDSTSAFGRGAHAEGTSSKLALNYISVSTSSKEDVETAWKSNKFALAYGEGSHVEGSSCLATGEGAHAEGSFTEASGDYSHAAGYYTKADQDYQTVVGKFNDSFDALFIVGNGESDSERRNAFMVNKDGTATVNTDPTNSNHVATKNYVDTSVASINTEITGINTEITGLSQRLTALGFKQPVFTNVNTTYVDTGYSGFSEGNITSLYIPTKRSSSAIESGTLLATISNINLPSEDVVLNYNSGDDYPTQYTVKLTTAGRLEVSYIAHGYGSTSGPGTAGMIVIRLYKGTQAGVDKTKINWYRPMS